MNVCPECNRETRMGVFHHCVTPKALAMCRIRIAELENERDHLIGEVSKLEALNNGKADEIKRLNQLIDDTTKGPNAPYGGV